MITLIVAAKIMILFVFALVVTYGILVGIIIFWNAIKDREFIIGLIIIILITLLIWCDIAFIEKVAELLKNG